MLCIKILKVLIMSRLIKRNGQNFSNPFCLKISYCTLVRFIAEYYSVDSME